MAAGLPVIASDMPTIRQVVSETNCGVLTDSTSAREWADAIIKLALDPDLGRPLEENGQKAAEGWMHWETEELKLQRLVSSLLPL